MSCDGMTAWTDARDAAHLAGLGGSAMQRMFDQFLQFIQQGVATIFKFIQLVWAWSVTQIAALSSVSWQNWPLWKQVLLVLIVAGVAWALYRVVMELWEASARILTAFATLIIALVNTLPSILLAGVLALGGMWVLNNFDPSFVQLPSRLSWHQTGE
jgi:hypothetical protein